MSHGEVAVNEQDQNQTQPSATSRPDSSAMGDDGAIIRHNQPTPQEPDRPDDGLLEAARPVTWGYAGLPSLAECPSRSHYGKDGRWHPQDDNS